MRINDYFRQEYLVAGNTYDNYVFENCSKEFLDEAQSSLSAEVEGVYPCVASISGGINDSLNQIFAGCTEEFQKKVLARDYAVAVVMRELLKYKPNEQESQAFVEEQIRAFTSGDFEKARELHSLSFMPGDIKKIAKTIGKIEVDFMLEDVNNQYLQQAINLFLSAREPYSVKVFTNRERLASYYDLNGNIIQCPHDFMTRDVRPFVEQSTNEKEQ